MKKVLALLLPGLLLAGLRISIIVDNTSSRKDLKTAHGFSALIEKNGVYILFDTGPSADILSFNLKTSGIKPEKIENIFLSNGRLEATGGLDAVLRQHQKVFILNNFPARVVAKIKKKGALPILIKEKKEILPGFYSSGPMGKNLKEQALFVKINEGIAILTGCGHSGILKIVERGEEYGYPLILIGGFHIAEKPGENIKKEIRKLKDTGVYFVGPTCCCKKKTMKVLSSFFGKKLIKTGSGFVLNIKEGKIK